MKKVAIIGAGYVGLVFAACLADRGHSVICCDNDREKIEMLASGVISIYEPGLEDLVNINVNAGRLVFTTDIQHAVQSCDIIYIAVGTPMIPTGQPELRYVVNVASTIGENLNSYKVIAVKSTVPVGTGRLIKQVIEGCRPHSNIPFDVVSNPEFLREGTAVSDCMNMERIVIGATRDRAAQIIRELHKSLGSEVFITDLENAEMIKYTANAFLATKISFINSIANICEKVGADICQVAKGVGMDSRIGESFLNAGIGYGGSCLPKDTHALVHLADQHGYSFELLKSVIEVNNRQMLVMIKKLEDILGQLEGKTISVLGLAFKPNTDDVREAPSLVIIPRLLRSGARVNVYDPLAIQQAKKYLGESVHYYEDIYSSVKNSDACLIVTEWDTIKTMDVEQVKKIMRTPIIVDGRNCLQPEAMQTKGIGYYSIGRKEIRLPDSEIYEGNQFNHSGLMNSAAEIEI